MRLCKCSSEIVSNLVDDSRPTSKTCGRMERWRDQRVESRSTMQSSSESTDGFLCAQDRSGRRIAQGHHYLWGDGSELPFEKDGTVFDFILSRRAICRRPALHHVGDVKLVSLNATVSKQTEQQLTRSTNERDTRGIFFCAWGLTNQHETCRCWPRGKDHTLALTAQFTGMTGNGRLFKFSQRRHESSRNAPRARARHTERRRFLVATAGTRPTIRLGTRGPMPQRTS